MAFTIRPLHTDEQKYTYRQSTQIEGQTGSIGYLRGDFGAGGKEFFSSWFDHRRDLKTDEFKSALDEVINALRSEEYGLLNSRTAMAQYKSNPDFIVRRLDPFQRVKSRCDKCLNFGYDYILLTRKSPRSGGEQNV